MVEAERRRSVRRRSRCRLGVRSPVRAGLRRDARQSSLSCTRLLFCQSDKATIIGNFDKKRAISEEKQPTKGGVSSKPPARTEPLAVSPSFRWVSRKDAPWRDWVSGRTSLLYFWSNPRMVPGATVSFREPPSYCQESADGRAVRTALHEPPRTSRIRRAYGVL